MSLPETPTRVVLFLSTLSLRRATFLFADHIELRAISIHALLAESDQPATKQAQNLLNFYPRSPCGERLVLLNSSIIVMIFLSTLSLRRATCQWRRSVKLFRQFLSTLSLRRATYLINTYHRIFGISIHALLAESDFLMPSMVVILILFLSTLSLRRATGKFDLLLLMYLHFYPRSPCGERPRTQSQSLSA